MFCLPPTDIGALVSQDNCSALLDWDQTTLLDTAEAARPPQVDGAQDIQQFSWRQGTADAQALHNRLAIGTTFDPAKLSFVQCKTPETPAHSPNVESTAASIPGSSSNGSCPHNSDNVISSPVSPLAKKELERRQQPERRRLSLTASTEAARAKNRIAATKCRRKKKCEERELEKRKQRLYIQRQILQEAADALTNEVLMLKREVLRHVACGFAPIDNYISRAAGRKSKM